MGVDAMLARDPIVHGGAPGGMEARPAGDPEAMRELARQLRLEAAKLSRFEALDLSSWQSRRARQVRAVLDGYVRTARGVCDDLNLLAATVAAEAGRVEQAQLTWVTREALRMARHSSIPEDKI